VLGWKCELVGEDPALLKLVSASDDDATILMYVSTGELGADRNHLGALIVAQTSVWQNSGADVKSILLYDDEIAANNVAELSNFAAKRSVGLLSKRSLQKYGADVLLAESDPDDVRMALVANLSSVKQ
jgi:hypothetical protein